MTTTPTSRPDLLSGRTLFRAGLTLLVLAAVFFLRYTIEQGWIGPLARVALAAGGGIVMIGAGLGVAQRRAAYGILLQGAGVAVLFLTAFAAHDHYALTSTTEAFIQLVAVAGLTIVLAHHSDSEFLAGMGLGAAAASPALIDGRMAVPGAETAYLVLVGGVSTVLFFRSGWWRAHTVAAIAVLASAVFDLGGSVDVNPSHAVALEFSLLIAWAMAVVVPLAGTFTRTGPAIARIALSVITSSVGSLVLYAGTRMIFFDSGTRPTWTMLALGLSLLHLVAARGLVALPEAQGVAHSQYIPAVVLAVVAAVEGLTGDWVLVGLAALATGLVIAGHRGGPRRLADAGHLLFVTTAVMTVGMTAIVTGGTRVLSQLVPGLIVLASGALIGWFVRSTSDRDLSPVYLGGAYLGALAWLAVEFPRLGADGLAWVTAGWSIIGVAAIVIGRLVASRITVGAGFAAVGLALGKLFFVDLAEASPIVRIALFSGVGLLLVAGGYWLGDWSLDDTEPDEADPHQTISDPTAPHAPVPPEMEG